MPTRLCAEPRCPNPSTYRGRCATHARTNDQNINRAGHTIYRTARWRNTRKRVLFEQPLCATPGCDAIATDVHHQQDLADGGDPWARNNLVGLCHQCHARITRRDQTA